MPWRVWHDMTTKQKGGRGEGRIKELEMRGGGGELK